MLKLNVQKRLTGAEGSLFLDVKFEIKEGEFVGILGESGSGKTSLLRMLSGLMTPDSGSIEISKQMVYNKKTKIQVKPQLRKVGMVFQDYALFPHLNAAENIRYGLTDHRDSNLYQDLVDIMELNELLKSYPSELSGGQKQRIALARTIANRPDLLLLDEPLSALDARMRYKLQGYLSALHKRFNLTILMVSHDSGEILKLTQRVLELRKGKILRDVSPKNFFSLRPNSAKFSFIGEILDIEQEGVLFIVSLLIGFDVVKIVADPRDLSELHPGDKVMVGSKAFNPIIQKI